VVGVTARLQETPLKPNYVQVAADLTSAESVDNLVAAALEPTGKIDALVHTVGGFAGGTPVHETDEATWDRMMNLNLKTTFLATRAVLHPMIEAGYGRIVAVGARPGVDPVGGLGAYSSSKAGLHALIQTIALEGTKYGVTANVLMPSIIDTPSNRQAMPDADFSKWVAPESVAQQILWLCSDEAADVSGALVPVYGRS